MLQQAQPFARQFQERMVSIEKKDRELWILVLLMLAAIGGGLFLVLLPSALFDQGGIQVNIRISPQLLLGFLVLVVMFIAYMIQKHFQIRSMRIRSLTDSWNVGVAHMQSLVDPLTHTLNRSALEAIFNREIKQARRLRSHLVFLYIDVNDFKSVNTQFGHLFGDRVLAEAGGILKRSVRGSDYVIRMGGDEFLLALVDTDVAGAGVVKKRINYQVGEWNRNSPVPGFVLSLSIGVQECDGASTLHETLAEADAKMYGEKKIRQATKQV